MLVTESFSVSVSVKDPIAFNEDLEANLMTLLRDRYKGRCIRNMLIQEILSVQAPQDSLLLTCITQATDDASGDISVNFTAQAVVFKPGELVNGGTVCVSKNDIIHISDPHTDIVIKGTDTLESLRDGQRVTYKVLKIESDPFEEKLMAIATLNLRYNNEYVVKSTTSLNVTYTTFVEILNAIKSLLERPIPADKMKFYASFIIDEYAASKSLISINAQKYSIKADTFYRFAFTPKGPMIDDVSSQVNLGKLKLIQESMTAENMIDHFLQVYYNLLFTIHGMHDEYKNVTEKEYSNLWSIYRSAK